MVFLYVAFHVSAEVTVVHNVYFLKAVEQVSRYGIAEAVFENHQSAVVLHSRPDLCYAHVATHKGAIGCSAAVFEVAEEVALVGLRR